MQPVYLHAGNPQRCHQQNGLSDLQLMIAGTKLQPEAHVFFLKGKINFTKNKCASSYVLDFQGGAAVAFEHR